MGIPSPFIGCMPSPLIRPGCLSPDLTILEDVVACDSFDIGKPMLPINEEKKYVEHQLEEYTTVEPDTCREPCPAWPTHVQRQCFIEKNTFLTQPTQLSSPVIGRQRAMSMTTGMDEFVFSGREVNLEDLQKPLDASSDASTELPISEALAALLKGADLEAYASKLCDRGCDSLEALWDFQMNEELDKLCDNVLMSQEDRAKLNWAIWHGSGDARWYQQPPILPVVPAGEPAFTPAWHYGSQWPFNRAPTTLEVRNLPSDMTVEWFLAVLDASGFAGEYDFVFLPMDRRNRRCKGHAIVNFTRHCHGTALAARINGFSDWELGSNNSPACEVKWSCPLQGQAELITVYSVDPCSRLSVPENCRPAIFVHGQRVPLPLPMWTPSAECW